MRCCGVTDYTDWYPVLGENTVPDRCCMENSQGCGRNSTTPLWKTVRLDISALGSRIPHTLDVPPRRSGGNWGERYTGVKPTAVCVWGGVCVCTHVHAHMCWTHTWNSEDKGLDGIEAMLLPVVSGAWGWGVATREDQGAGAQ